MNENEYVPEEFKTKQEFIDRFLEIDNAINETHSAISDLEISIKNLEAYQRFTRNKIKKYRGGVSVLAQEKTILLKLMDDKFPS